MHLTTDKAMDSKTARAFKEKVLLEGEIIVEPCTRTDRGLSDFGWMARFGPNNGDDGNGGNSGNSGHDGSDGHARSADDGTNGRAGIARTICVL